MTLLSSLNPTRFSWVTCIQVKGVFNELVKCPVITAIESKQYACANMIGIINTFGELQDNWLEYYQPLEVKIYSVYSAEFYRQDSKKYTPNFPAL